MVRESAAGFVFLHSEPVSEVCSVPDIICQRR